MTSRGEKVTQNVFAILLKWVTMLASSFVVIGNSGDQDLTRRGTELVLKKQTENWDGTVAPLILQLVTISGHPVFRASSPLEKGVRKTRIR